MQILREQLIDYYNEDCVEIQAIDALIWQYQNQVVEGALVWVSKAGTGAIMTLSNPIVSITTFGAFAQIIPGVDGLVHISQISHKHIGTPAEVLKVGDVVKAKIMEIDFDKKRVSLSIKALVEPPVVEETPAPEVAETVAEEVTEAPVEE